MLDKLKKKKAKMDTGRRKKWVSLETPPNIALRGTLKNSAKKGCHFSKPISPQQFYF